MYYNVDKNLYPCYCILMSNQQMMTILKNFQKAPAKGKMRREYFAMFEKKMVYRTTKTENPEVTLKMVDNVFKKLTLKT